MSSILACLNSFLNDPKLVKNYGDAAKLRAAKDFDANLITEHWVDFYKRYIN